MSDTLQPGVSLLTKIGSIALHADEYLSPHGHEFDRDAILSLLADPEVAEWMASMEEMALLPRKRNP